jgi:hypothetical protein
MEWGATYAAPRPWFPLRRLGGEQRAGRTPRCPNVFAAGQLLEVLDGHSIELVFDRVRLRLGVLLEQVAVSSSQLGAAGEPIN